MPQNPRKADATALTVADELGMRSLAARCRLGLGIARGHRTNVAAALDLLTTFGTQLWREQAERALAKLP